MSQASIEFQVGEKTYVAKQLSAMKQLHIARKMAPVLAGLAPAGAGFKNGLEGAFMATLPSLAEKLASMKDEDADFVVLGLLSACSRRESGGGLASLVSGSGTLMFQDINMKELIEIAVESGKHNFSDFFNALPQNSKSANHSANVQ
jgi:hypothetical protein